MSDAASLPLWALLGPGNGGGEWERDGPTTVWSETLQLRFWGFAPGIGRGVGRALVGRLVFCLARMKRGVHSLFRSQGFTLGFRISPRWGEGIPLRITDHRPPPTDHRSPPTDHRPPITAHRSPPTDHRPPITKSTIDHPISSIQYLPSCIGCSFANFEPSRCNFLEARSGKQEAWKQP
ncbi:MAG: hypothetical protein RLZ97_975 [Verrucomicrobiota bacterium]